MAIGSGWMLIGFIPPWDYEGAPVGETHVATGKQDAARRIEYLSQIVKVCILADDNDFDAANPGFIDGQSDVSNTITDYVLLGGGSLWHRSDQLYGRTWLHTV